MGPLAAVAAEGAADHPVAAEAPVAISVAPRAAVESPPSKDRQVKNKLRPNGPVTVTASSVDWAKNGLMIYIGDVKLSSDTLNMDGDRLELEQLGNGAFRAKVTGAPAHLLHSGDVSEDGKDEPPVTARGKQLNYDSESGLADVLGDARVTRGENEITGESIHYNVNERRIQAAGGSGGQVRIVIQPPPKEKAGESSMAPPSPAAVESPSPAVPAVP